jgi:hypothetical protein
MRLPEEVYRAEASGAPKTDAELTREERRRRRAQKKRAFQAKSQQQVGSAPAESEDHACEQDGRQACVVYACCCLCTSCVRLSLLYCLESETVGSMVASHTSLASDMVHACLTGD